MRFQPFRAQRELVTTFRFPSRDFVQWVRDLLRATLQRLEPTEVKEEAYTAAVWERVLYDPTSKGGFTITAPDGVEAGERWGVKNQSSDTSAMTIARSAKLHTLDGANTDSISTARGYITYEFDGVSDWMVVAEG